MKKINVAIVGYGNVGRGVEKALKRNSDMELAAIFTRRPEQVKREVGDVLVLPAKGYVLPKGLRIDVAILCGGSKKDIPVQGPAFAKKFNTVDGFDTHAKIPSYLQKMDPIAKEHGNVSIISAGWDPGILSLVDILNDAFLPQSKSYTFWGGGVSQDEEDGGASQGHADAARRVKGVRKAKSYTIPIEEAIQQVRAGETPELSKREMHKRRVYVVAEKHADLERIRREITEMPDYFDEYDTEVIFISQEEMDRKHSKLPHSGFVFTSGLTGKGNRQTLEYRCQLESNPEFTASVLVAYARAAYRLNKQGCRGAFTVSGVTAELISPRSKEVLTSRFI